MPIYYDPETGEYFRSNGNRLVEVKKMGDLKSGGDPMDDGMDPMESEEDAMDLEEDAMETEMAKKKGKAPAKGKK